MYTSNISSTNPYSNSRSSISWGYSNSLASAWGMNFDDDEDDETQSAFGKSEENEKDCTLFVIDCHESMFMSGAKLFTNVCQAITKALKSKIIKSKDDQISVVFYNTRETLNALNKANIYIFIAPNVPSAKIIKDIKHLPIAIEQNFLPTIGHLKGEKQCDFRDLLWVLQTIYTEIDTSGTKFGSKRSFIFTNNDNPLTSDMPSTYAKANDMLNTGIEISVFPLLETFNINNFYLNICTFSRDEYSIHSPQQLLKSCPTLEDLVDTLRVKEMKKRSLISCPLQINNDFAIAVKMFSLVRRMKKEAPVFLHARSNQPLQTITRWVCKDSGDTLQNFEIKTYYEYSPMKSKIFFQKSEIQQLKTFGNPSLVLMGFKPLTRLKKYYNLKPALFLYPNEQRIEGSVLYFNTMIKVMTEMKEFAVARFIYRKSNGPQFVALVAQLEVVDDDGHQIQAPGMHVIYLPYADDIRKIVLEDGERKRCDLECEDMGKLVKKAEMIVDNLTLPEMPYPSNPVLQQHFDALEILALEEDEKMDEDGDFREMDEISMKDEDMQTLAAVEINSFLEELNGIACNSLVNEKPVGDGRKRGFGGESDGVKIKVRKTVKKESFEEAAKFDWAELMANDELKSLKVVDLKKYLAMNGLKVSGKKSILVERIEQHLNKD